MSPVATPPEHLATWERTAWHGEPAWTSVSGTVRATVSEARARLIYLGPAEGQNNLLNAPWPRATPSDDDPWPNHGGHRFWLGPQHRWVWPPPLEWEYRAARAVAVHGGTLTVEHAHLDPAYPTLTREYAWHGGQVRCTVRWLDDGGNYFGLHVVAVDTPFRITARLEPSPGVPAGFVAARMVDPEPALQLPHPAVTLDGNFATVHGGIQRVKLGFVPQGLDVERPGGWLLRVLPGPRVEADGVAPDQGFLSQVWVGGPECTLAELEQLTPHLHGDAFGRCSSTIFIEAVPPTP